MCLITKESLIYMDDDLEPFWQGLLSIERAGFFASLTLEVVIGIGVLLVLILFSALISGSETAFFSLTPQKINSGSQRKTLDTLILKLLGSPRKLLATILIANNFINVGIVILGTYITRELFMLEGSPILTFLIQVIVLTAILLLLGEITPKVFAAHAPRQFARFMATPLLVLKKIFSPLSSLLVSSTAAIDKRIKNKGHEITMEDIHSAIDLTRSTREQTPQEAEERKILKGIAKLGNIEVKEIMKPRVDVVAVEESEKYHQVLNVINESGYSRIPVYRESFDNIQGVIYIKDFLGSLGEPHDFTWTSLIRPAFFVPENKKINDLLLEFKEKKIHLAVVVDEYGGVSGIVTMEDILEEIVGEIVDEFDPEEEHLLYKRISENKYLFEGKVLLNDFCKTMQIESQIFDEVRGEADTLAGFLLERLGHFPEKGTTVKQENFTFIVDKVSDRRISRIIVLVNEEQKT